ncbi:hypothetical protein RUM43_002797 [Polyplax serrata]|uniref:Uncharacterized protein n=1 Tax=Polyplax serrata TaxID=468196 RepID=A0AAN8NVC7_POLSC
MSRSVSNPSRKFDLRSELENDLGSHRIKLSIIKLDFINRRHSIGKLGNSDDYE